jgi:ribosome-binding factor A
LKVIEKLMNKMSQKDLLHPKSVVVAEGAPNFLTKSRGDQKTISRRQKMLNNHFMQGISDVLANDTLGTVLREYEVTITHVEVGQHYNILNIYWTTKRSDIHAIGVKLGELTGKLHKKMIEKNFMTVIPIIKFNFDRSKINIDTVNSLLAQDENLQTNPVSPQDFIPPSQAATGYHFLDPLGPRFRAKKVALFHQEFKEEQERKHNSPDSVNYQTLKFVHPSDMKLDVQGLDYEKVMNVVLSRLKKARSQTNKFVADPLPPAVWVEEPKLPPEHEVQRRKILDTTTRLSVMRQFIANNKRQKSHKYRERIKEEEEMIEAVAQVHKEIKDRVFPNNDVVDAVHEHDDRDYMEEDDVTHRNK